MAALLRKFKLAAPEGQSALIPITSHHINNMVLAADTAETVTVPAGAGYVIINADLDIWVNFEGSVAIVPTTEITDGTGHELNPGARLIDQAKTFSVVSAGAAKCSYAFYSLT